MPHNDEPLGLPPRDLEGLRKWRIRAYEAQKKRELEKLYAPLATTPSPKPKPLKEKVKEPGQFPLIGERAKKRGPGNREAGEGYIE